MRPLRGSRDLFYPVFPFLRKSTSTCYWPARFGTAETSLSPVVSSQEAEKARPSSFYRPHTGPDTRVSACLSASLD